MNVMADEKTSIRIGKDFRDELRGLKQGGESYEEMLRRKIDEVPDDG